MGASLPRADHKFIFGALVKLNSEIHIFGTASLRRGMVLKDLARAKRPIIYTASDFPEGALSLEQELKDGFVRRALPRTNPGLLE